MSTSYGKCFSWQYLKGLYLYIPTKPVWSHVLLGTFLPWNYPACAQLGLTSTAISQARSNQWIFIVSNAILTVRCCSSVLLHYSGIHWCVSEGLCQVTVLVLGGAESAPDRSAWSSLLHLSENSLFFPEKVMLKTSPECLAEKKSSFHPSWKINLWFFLPKSCMFNIIHVFFKWSGKDENHRILPVFWNLCFKACKGSVISTQRLS